MTARFNGAMTFQPWIPQLSGATMAASLGRFNGAMTFQPWIPSPAAVRNAARHSFNGAMTFQPWIHPVHLGLLKLSVVASMEP